MHITSLQDTEKRTIMNSNEKKICEAICGADYEKGYFSVSPQYQEWTRKIGSITVGSGNVTRESVLSSPYQGFNPTQFVGQSLPKLSDLKEELYAICGSVDDALHQILSDNTLLANKDILDSSEQGLLDRFNSKAEELSPINA